MLRLARTGNALRRHIRSQTMLSVLNSMEFWIGAILLCCFQVGKFSELNTLDEDLKDWPGGVLNLRASDFLGHKSYLGLLALFLLVTFAGFFLACLVAPSLILGWIRITSNDDISPKIDEIFRTVPYPLYIAAAFMGLAHQAIPGFSRIANLQRDIFHHVVGVPKIVVATSNYFATQILAQSTSRDELAARLKSLAQDSWQVQIEKFADAKFYSAELERLKLEDADAVEEVVAGTPRELRGLVKQLVSIAAIAAVRKSGGTGLENLAKALGVSMPERNQVEANGLIAGILLSILGLTVLWFTIPVVEPIVDAATGNLEIKFWPLGPDALYSCGIYLLCNVVPVLLAIVILVVFLPMVSKDSAGNTNLNVSFERNAYVLLAAMLAVILFDYVQAISDAGLVGGDYLANFNATTARLVVSWFPYFLLHSAVVVAICFMIVVNISRRNAMNNGIHRFFYYVLVLLSAGLLSALYAEARLYYQFQRPGAIDYIILIALLNMAAASIAWEVARFVYNRRIGKATQPGALGTVAVAGP
jgi:hypothetical protein